MSRYHPKARRGKIQGNSLALEEKIYLRKQIETQEQLIERRLDRRQKNNTRVN